MIPPQAAMLGSRLHLQHGPIDLMVEAWGEAEEVSAAYAQARTAFESMLQTLVDELAVLKQATCRLQSSGPVAKRMIHATSCHPEFITPMAAVAGSVADHILAAMRAGRRLSKAIANNGGDIALWLSDSEQAIVGVGDLGAAGMMLYPVTLRANDHIGGIATSGWQGRSHSLGIADFVTVFAKDSAIADAAATLIANAVDVPGCEAVKRAPAETLSPDSDLGERLVTVDVGYLSDVEISTALNAGRLRAKAMQKRGMITVAVIGLKGQCTLIKSETFQPVILNQSDELPLMGETA